MKTSSLSARGTLLASALGFVIVLLDVSVINVALDALRHQFATDVVGLQWVINAYSLAFAALLLTSGALGDRFGAWRVFLAGFAVFTLASAACALSDSLQVLVGARLLQGLGAALLVPNSLAMLQQAFTDAKARSRAVGWWAALGGVSLAAGPILGGVLVTHFGWRSIFLINLPIGVIGTLMTLRYAPRMSGQKRKVDWSGQMLAVLALASLTFALTEAGRLGGAHASVRGSGALAVIAFSAFIWVESRVQSPMLPLALFRAPGFAVASASGVIVNFAYYGLIFVFSLFFQIQQGLSPELTGLAFIPMTLVLVAVNVLAGRMIGRVGPRFLMVLGSALAAVGYLSLLGVSIEGSYWYLVAPMLVASSGIALIVPTMTNITLSSVDASRAGVAAGVLNSSRQLGGMLGVAVFGYLVRDTAPKAFMHGMHLSITIAALLLIVGSVLSWRGIRPSACHAAQCGSKRVQR